MNPLLTRVIEEAAKVVEPDEKESRNVSAAAEHALKLVEEATSEFPQRLHALLGGSYAKGTWLKGEADVDIFVKFPTTVERKEFEELGVAVGMKAFKGLRTQLRFAEHPYVEGWVNEVRVNVVPCYDVEKGQWKSAADRSPFHTEYVKEHLREESKLEVRLLKKFMKSVGIYGAEVATKGFSGYVCEVLTLKYGFFANLLERAAEFREGEVVSLEDVSEDYVRRLFKSHIIVLDPVDSRRNLGTAVSAENVAAFILAARNFLSRPSLEFFSGGPHLVLRGRRGRLANVITILFKHEKRSVDILWGQLWRSVNHLVRQVEVAGFKVMRASCASDDVEESAFVFLLEDLELSQRSTRLGPKVFSKVDCDRFLEKNMGKAELFWVGSDGRVHISYQRAVRTARDVLNGILKKGSSSYGIAPGLGREVESTFAVYEGSELRRAMRSRQWLEEEVARLVGSNPLIFTDA